MTTTQRNEITILTLAAETESQTIVRPGCAGSILATFSVTHTAERTGDWGACLVVVTGFPTSDGGAKFIISTEGDAMAVVLYAIQRLGAVHDNAPDAMRVALEVAGWA
jgi:hypothetical protein